MVAMATKSAYAYHFDLKISPEHFGKVPKFKKKFLTERLSKPANEGENSHNPRPCRVIHGNVLPSSESRKEQIS